MGRTLGPSGAAVVRAPVAGPANVRLPSFGIVQLAAENLAPFFGGRYPFECRFPIYEIAPQILHGRFEILNGTAVFRYFLFVHCLYDAPIVLCTTLPRGFGVTQFLDGIGFIGVFRTPR